MRIPCALNGFGRIGKSFLRAVLSNRAAREMLDIRVINVGHADPQDIEYSLKYDTVMGRYVGNVSYENGVLTVDDQRIEIIAELDPEKLPWKRYGIVWVVDASGAYTKRERATYHIKAGAQKVLITAPADSEDIAIVPGVNEDRYDPRNHAIVSLGSCTTNALFPLLNLMHKALGVERAIVTTVHSYTPSQSLHDGIVQGGDPRRARAAAANIVPASTGAAKMVTKIMPELAGKIAARSVRVPVIDVSLLEMMLVTSKPCSVENIHEIIQSAAKKIPTIVGISDQPLVSSDFRGDEHSIVVDTTLTDAVSPLCHIAGWYDNEWGYSCRLRDFLCSL